MGVVGGNFNSLLIVPHQVLIQSWRQRWAGSSNPRKCVLGVLLQGDGQGATRIDGLLVDTWLQFRGSRDHLAPLEFLRRLTAWQDLHITTTGALCKGASLAGP